jgi:hypothetical protein
MRTYVIYCEPCGYKKVVEDPLNVDLVARTVSNVPGRIPVLNKQTNKTETFDPIPVMPKFKCPKCGRGVTLKKYNVPKSQPNVPEPKQEHDTSE